MAGWKSHEEIGAYQHAYELKMKVYALISTGSILRDNDLHDQLQRSAAAAPRLIAEGFGRYLPDDFSKYLRDANAELKETYESLRDGVDRGHFTEKDVVPLQRLSKRASKAATGLIRYLKTSEAPNEPRRRRSGKHRRRGERAEPNPPEHPEPKPPEPKPPEPKPPEPPERMELPEPPAK